MERLSTNLIMKSLGFHGQPLQKVWEGERGENDLIINGITNPDYSVYRIRQKTLTFQDRAKRLKLHQFLAKKAEFLYGNSLVNDNIISKNFNQDKNFVDSINHLPYYEYFLNIDKNKRQRYFFESCQTGDLVYGSLTSKVSGGFAIKIHCSVGLSPRYLTDLNVKAFLPHSLAVTLPEKKNRQTPVTVDYVLCEIVEVVPDIDKMIVTMKGEKEDVKYGIIKLDDFPEVYKQLTNSSEAPYDTILENSPGFNNPYCFEVLEEQLGLSSFEHYTNMSSLRGRFPQQEYSNELRQVQASKWAFRSVAEGIEHFKEGRHSEAFQCLNKALNIDPRNVEGLVARGALYANSGSFKKAVEDFETALKLNPSHANARKYMGETLVALGRSYEEENKIDEARKAYQDCLAIIPHHEEAQNSLDFLKSKTIGKQFIEPGELQLPPLNITKSSLDQNKLNEASTSGSNKRSDLLDDKKSKKMKKKKSRGSKKERRSTSSSSESDSSDSSDSSSESSSSTESSSTSDSEVNSHSKKKRQRKRQKSMSPLSKRMSLMNESGDGNNFPNQLGGDSNHDSGLDDYELKVRKFLEMTRDEDDYEEKVRRFVEEASKYRKERKILEEKAKKKKRKEAKKLKKESKKRRREKDREERKKAKQTKKMETKLDLDAIENKKIREALKLFENFPVLDEIGNKLSSLLEKSNANLEIEKLEKNSRNVAEGLYESFMEEQGSGGKWKMAFSKEKGKKQEPPPQASSSSSKSIPKQYAFTNESETDDERDASLGAPIQHPPPPPPSNTDKIRKRNQSPRSKYVESNNQLSKPVVKSGPVVLDKFGNFRLANMETNKPPEPPGSPKRMSRSRSRSRPARKYSSSRSRSRSPRKRSRSGSYIRKYSRSRSRSRSFRSRTRSRTPRSRSYSRSRSRSRSVRRYGGDRRNFRGRGGYNERGTYYKPRFSNNTRGRGGRGNYHDYKDYRGGRDRGRPFRPRAARGGNRYYRYRGGSRERRYSRDRSENRDRRSYSNENERGRQENVGSDGETKKVGPPSPGHSTHRRDEASKNSPDIEGRWAEKAKSDQQTDLKSIDRQDSLEEMEKIISKAKKENKEDMIERNKDILKKSSNPW